MNSDQEKRPIIGEVPTTDNGSAALNELLFRLARMLGRQTAEDQIRQLQAANDNSPAGGDKVDRARTK